MIPIGIFFIGEGMRTIKWNHIRIVTYYQGLVPYITGVPVNNRLVLFVIAHTNGNVALV